MIEHAQKTKLIPTYFEKADQCTFPLVEKQQIITVASEME